MARFSSPLGGAGLLSLCLWLSGCWAVWRYKTPIESYVLFTTSTTMLNWYIDDILGIVDVSRNNSTEVRCFYILIELNANEIYLQYEGTEFVEWNAPSFCTFDNKRSPDAILNCPVAGTHMIKPEVLRASFEDMERYLTIHMELNCFLWYVRPINGSILRDTQDVIIWIYDPESANPSEQENTATRPSLYSRTLSKQFWNMGLSPEIKTRVRRNHYASTAFPEEGFWIAKVPVIADDIIADIQGKAITFQDCFVADTPFIIADPEINFFRTYEVSISSPPGSDIILSWSSCIPTKAILVTDSGTFMTMNGFKTSTEVKFPSTVIDRSLASRVTEVALGYNSILFLIGGTVYSIRRNGIHKLGENSNFPVTGIKRIQARMWCASQYPEENLGTLSEFIAWTENIIFLGRDGTWFFQIVQISDLKELLGLRSGVDIALINACYDSCISEISFLLVCTGCSSSRIFFLAMYDEEGDWFLRDFYLPAPPGRTLDMAAVNSAISSMLLWDKDMVYYSYKGNRINGYVKVSGTDRKLSAASEGTTIQQIIIDHGGNTIIKMKNNVMYFFKFKTTHVIKLHAWEDESKTSVLSVNPHGGFYLLTVNGSNILRQEYPLRTEILSATHSSREVCPYISFQHNMELDVYYVDMGRNVTFWTQIVFLENLGLATEVTIHKPDLLKQKSFVNYEIARGICTKNKTITLYHDQDYSQVFDYKDVLEKAVGIMTVELQPSSTGPTCTAFPKLAYVSVGCPPTKHVVIKKPSHCTDEKFLFEVPKSQMLNTEGRAFDYDKEVFGCPIDALYEKPFRPTVILYENNKFVQYVESEYILWEINGRNDFSYNATMEEVRCLREAQSWSKMLHESHQTNPDIDELWGPHNYKSCFRTEHSDIGDLKQPYQILNHSGLNSIIWPKDHSGLYLFKLKILDPNFSFCDFLIHFAVHTYGIAESPHTAKIVAWSVFVVSLFLGLLILSYFWYVKIFRAISFVDPLLSLHSHFTATHAAKEMKKKE